MNSNEFIRNVRKHNIPTLVIDVGSTSGLVVAVPRKSTWVAVTYEPKGETLIEKAIDLGSTAITFAKNEEIDGRRIWVAVVRWPGAARTKFSYGAETAYLSAIGAFAEADERPFCILNERKAREEIIKSRSKMEVENWWKKTGLPTTSSHVRDATVGAIFIQGLKNLPKNLYLMN
jgi:hypothetical protein